MTMIPRRALLAFALSFGALALAGSAAATVAWVQMVAGGAEIRLVTSAAACPTVKIDGAERSTRERAGPGEAFANRVCAARLHAGDRRIVVDGLVLPAPVPGPSGW